MNGVTAPDRPLDTFRPDISMDQLRLVLWLGVVPTDTTLGVVHTAAHSSQQTFILKIILYIVIQ